MCEGVEYVQKAYKMLNPDKKSTDDDKSGNDIENFSQSLFVECAERAISVKSLLCFLKKFFIKFVINFYLVQRS